MSITFSQVVVITTIFIAAISTFDIQASQNKPENDADNLIKKYNPLKKYKLPNQGKLPVQGRDPISGAMSGVLSHPAFLAIVKEMAMKDKGQSKSTLKKISDKNNSIDKLIQDYRNLRTKGEVDCKIKEKYVKDIGHLIDMRRNIARFWLKDNSIFNKSGTVNAKYAIMGEDYKQRYKKSMESASIAHSDVHSRGGSIYSEYNDLNEWRVKFLDGLNNSKHECFGKEYNTVASKTDERLVNSLEKYQRKSPYDSNLERDNYKNFRIPHPETSSFSSEQCELILQQINETKNGISRLKINANNVHYNQMAETALRSMRDIHRDYCNMEEITHKEAKHNAYKVVEDKHQNQLDTQYDFFIRTQEKAEEENNSRSGGSKCRHIPGVRTCGVK